MKKRYTFVGGGRLQKHFSHYFSSLNIEFVSWTRQSSRESLHEKILKSDYCLLAISDSALESFLAANPEIPKSKCVHFSGATVIEGVKCCHPLMTFGPKLYDLDFYPKIPFVIDSGLSFHDIFPDLKNPWFCLEPHFRPLYHAYCVLGGNFTTILWQEVSARFESELKLPSDILYPFFQKILEQFLASPTGALTGPFARKDKKTIQKNLNALEKNPSCHHIYKTFAEVYAKELLA